MKNERIFEIFTEILSWVPRCGVDGCEGPITCEHETGDYCDFHAPEGSDDLEGADEIRDAVAILGQVIDNHGTEVVRQALTDFSKLS